MTEHITLVTVVYARNGSSTISSYRYDPQGASLKRTMT